ncbi:MAG: hypothetical protein M1470_10085 [Bacteroidetes bacterium]|nr:hypothetical protein [Bacteroidota bacterium]
MEKKTHVIIASLILSILVWLSVSMNNEYSVTIRVPFRVNDLPNGLALASPIPRTILVRARGTGWQLATAYFSTSSSIDLDASNFERRRIILTSRDLGYSLDLGSSAEVLSFTPDTVVITVDTIITKRVPIVPRIEVEPRKNFTLVGSPEISPDSVTISGARRLVSSINVWYTKSRKFKDVNNEINAAIPLADTLDGIIKLDIRRVNAAINVQQITENTYRNIPVRILNNTDSVQILLLPPTVDVTVRGGIKTVSEMTADSLSVTVNYNNLIHSTATHFQPDVAAPPTLQVISIQPDSVEFIKRK